MKPFVQKTSALGLIMTLTACGSIQSLDPKDYYLHDLELKAAAEQAEELFKGASTKELWPTMLANADVANAAMQESLTDAQRLTFKTQVNAIDSAAPLLWKTIADCGAGTCTLYGKGDLKVAEGLSVKWSPALSDELLEAPSVLYGASTTAERQTIVMREIKEISNQIATLQGLMRNDPDGKKKIADASPAPSSTLSTLISDLEQSIADVDAKVNDAKARLVSKFGEAIDKLRDQIPDALSPTTRQAIADGLETGFSAFERVQDKISTINKFPSVAEKNVNEAVDAAVKSAFGGSVPSAVKNVIKSLKKEVGKIFDSRLLKVPFEKLGLRNINDAITQLLGEARNIANAVLEEDPSDVGGSAFQRMSLVIEILRKSENKDLLGLGSVTEILMNAKDHAFPSSVTHSLKKITGGLEIKTVGDLLAFAGQEERLLSDLLKGVSVAKLFEDLKGRELSDKLATALTESTGKKGADAITTIGGLLSYLQTDESKLQEVRVSLVKDWRKAVVENRVVQLNGLEARLNLMQRLLQVLQQQLAIEDGVTAQLSKFTKRYKVKTGGGVYADLNKWAVKDNRAAFKDGARIVGFYFSRMGYLRDAETNTRLEITRHDHRVSIERSQAAAQAYEALIGRGLQGLRSFTEGGLKAEDFASVLRFLNTGLLTAIAGAEVD